MSRMTGVLDAMRADASVGLALQALAGPAGAEVEIGLPRGLRAPLLALAGRERRPLLAVTAQGVTVYGTPWNGKHFRGTNMSAPLRAICILERAEENRIESGELADNRVGQAAFAAGQDADLFA